MLHLPTSVRHLYLHIPFCARLCHYCDFAKTANFDPTLVRLYFEHLLVDWHHWRNRLGIERAGLATLFVGGGTPSLFTDAYAPLMTEIAPYLELSCEVTIEANPQDVTSERLQAWRDLGFNRLSIGVQSLLPQGLRALTRTHSVQDARKAIDCGVSAGWSVNADMILGWEGQALDDWIQELEVLVSTGVRHVSLYALTFEPQTPLGRRMIRTSGSTSDERADCVAQLYDGAASFLQDRGWYHYEVSNWATTAQDTCRHNESYWNDSYYLGLGAGAHGYLPDGANGFGFRYQYPRSERQYAGVLARRGEEVDVRTWRDWRLEYLATSLRTIRGVDLDYVFNRTGSRMGLTPTLDEAFRRGLLRSEGSRWILHPSEWFRESAWVRELDGAWDER